MKTWANGWRRTWKGFLVGALAAGVLAIPAWWANAQNRRVPAGIVAHEWGVWLIRRGAIEHLDALAAESPPFVHRTQRPWPPPVVPPAPNPVPPGPPPGPGPGPMPPPVARKPVLFLYATQPTAVRITVGFEGGAPWLYYPAAAESQPQPSQRALSWNLRVLPRQAGAQLQPVARDHWWSDLRRVGASMVLANVGEAERFVFYDGPVGFRPVFRLQRSGAGAEVAPLSSERAVWLVGAAGRYVHHEAGAQGGGMRSLDAGDGAGLRRSLDAALRARGLSAAESSSLLDTWRDELFRAAGPRAVYFLPRAHYDSMLPLRIEPTPAQLVRVGLVIETLE